MNVEFTIPGQLRGKGRPKFTTIGGFARAYTPKETENAEAMVRSFGQQAMAGRPLMDGPVSLCVTMFKQHPESWSRKKKAAAKYVTGKPDCDNVIKLLGDALNGVIWKDDSQVAIINMMRLYDPGPEQVRVVVAAADSRLV